MKNKSVTLIGLNFYPESTAIGLYSTQLARHLVEQGAKLNVITAFPYYPQWEIAPDYKDRPRFLTEEHENMTLHRFRQYTPAKPTFLKRVIHIVDFTIGSFMNLWKIKECDYVISVVPFTSSAFLGYIQKKRFKAKHWIHVQDFEFDAAFQSGVVQSGKKRTSLLHRMLMWVERRTLSSGDRVSTISHLMMNSLSQKTKTTRYFLPNWIDQNDIDPLKSNPHPYLSSSKFKLLYSGSIADKQDWDFFMKLVEQLDFSRFEIVIVGDGAQRRQLQERIEGHSGIQWHSPVAYEELSDLLCSADVHFLFQKTEVLDTVMPSKILGMMASAKPSIITGHPESEVAKVMSESKGGFYVADNNMEEVLQYLEALCENKEEANEMGKKARSYVTTHFAKDPILEQFTEELAQL